MLSVIMLSVNMLSVIMLSVIMLSVIMLSVIMLSVIMPSVVMLNDFMLSVVSPILHWQKTFQVLFNHFIKETGSVITKYGPPINLLILPTVTKQNFMQKFPFNLMKLFQLGIKILDIR